MFRWGRGRIFREKNLPDPPKIFFSRGGINKWDPAV